MFNRVLNTSLSIAISVIINLIHTVKQTENTEKSELKILLST